ncbi:hypothetical protein QQP08_021905 [Theobroma cacao]|nr:hypothetical protein QQP08_021905 [Theobroma cacao]
MNTKSQSSKAKKKVGTPYASYFLFSYFSSSTSKYRLMTSCITYTKPQRVLIKHLLNITNPEEQFSVVGTTFSPRDENEAKDPKALYIQRLFILKEIIEEEYLDQRIIATKQTKDKTESEKF